MNRAGPNHDGDAPWQLGDERLLGGCDCHTYRASGPGGQKRNKTDSAVRLRHRETGVTVTATESRSQTENRRRALRRIRLALAVSIRRPPGETTAADQGWLDRAGRVCVGRRDLRYPDVVAAALDRVAAAQGSVADAAAGFGVSTAQFVRFLHTDSSVWAEANRIRARSGLPTLR